MLDRSQLQAQMLLKHMELNNKQIDRITDAVFGAPREVGRTIWAFYDERDIRVYVADEPHAVEYNRKGRWVEFRSK